ncbi:hypothetical protein HRI_003699800 [Hibiscus trionum]|uniref:Late embryogenesis abundant protein LEA-2 subgroup domain-containing protein n=1 Tax=Hibiscus trionum TaxID=183268 RepID=A0A9W7IQA4_HIBTR|nr:hypothetical protein HRI_003699800 [Hibiscus trionum]
MQQHQPLAPVQDYPRSDMEFGGIKPRPQEKNSKCLVYVLAIMVIQGAVLLIFGTIFLRARTPGFEFGSVGVRNLKYRTNSSSPTFNFTLVTAISIENTNFGEFRFDNTTGTVWCGSVVVGEFKMPTGRAQARATQRLNVSVDVSSVRVPNTSGLSNLFTDEKLYTKKQQLAAFRDWFVDKKATTDRSRHVKPSPRRLSSSTDQNEDQQWLLAPEPAPPPQPFPPPPAPAPETTAAIYDRSVDRNFDRDVKDTWTKETSSTPVPATVEVEEQEAEKSKDNLTLKSKESYYLQVMLARRLTSQASLFGEPLLLQEYNGPGVFDAETVSYRLWVSGCLSYNDKISYGFYNILRMNPYLWVMCNEFEQGRRLPHLCLLKRLNPARDVYGVMDTPTACLTCPPPQGSAASAEPEPWVVDSGATHHVTHDSTKLVQGTDFTGPGAVTLPQAPSNSTTRCPISFPTSYTSSPPHVAETEVQSDDNLPTPHQSTSPDDPMSSSHAPDDVTPCAETTERNSTGPVQVPIIPSTPFTSPCSQHDVSTVAPNVSCDLESGHHEHSSTHIEPHAEEFISNDETCVPHLPSQQHTEGHHMASTKVTDTITYAMVEQEQVKPFAPMAFRARSSNDHEALSLELQSKNRRYVHCCGSIAALFLILATVVLALFFTVFRIQDPMVRLNSITIQSLEISNKGILRTDVNVTLLADVSVKNPNAATFRFGNGTTMIYYGGRVVGEGIHSQGEAKPRRTLRRNVTVEINPEKFLADPSFVIDIIGSKELNVSSYTRISGRINIMNIIKRNVLVKFNCSTTFRLALSGGAFHEEKCMPELDF